MRNKRYGRGFAGNGRKHPKPSYFPIVLILCLSVGCGYATAKYVVDPGSKLCAADREKGV